MKIKELKQIPKFDLTVIPSICASPSSVEMALDTVLWADRICMEAFWAEQPLVNSPWSPVAIPILLNHIETEN